MRVEAKEWTKREIYELRRSLRLSQSKFAQRLGVHYMAVSFWERGKREPNIENLRLLDTLEKEG